MLECLFTDALLSWTGLVYIVLSGKRQFITKECSHGVVAATA